MKHIAIHIFIALALFLSLSCERPYPCEEPKLVIEGWIENGENPIVMVSLSGTMQNVGTPLSEFVANWSKVTINDGEKDYVLVGMKDTKYMPANVFRSYELEGEVGRTYKLKVEYKDMVATAQTTILPPTAIDSVVVAPAIDCDSLYTIDVHFTSPTNEADYYYLRYKNYPQDGRYFLSFMGSQEITGSMPDVIRLVPATISDTEGYSPYFAHGATVDVRLSRIGQEAYNVLVDYDEAIAFSYNMFIQSQHSLRSNIVGGYGYWIGYGITSQRVYVTP